MRHLATVQDELHLKHFSVTKFHHFKNNFITQKSVKSTLLALKCLMGMGGRGGAACSHVVNKSGWGPCFCPDNMEVLTDCCKPTNIISAVNTVSSTFSC